MHQEFSAAYHFKQTRMGFYDILYQFPLNCNLTPKCIITNTTLMHCFVMDLQLNSWCSNLISYTQYRDLFLALMVHFNNSSDKQKQVLSQLI